MSEKANDLRDTIQAVMEADAKWGDMEPKDFARAICEHLGLTWDDVDEIDEWVVVFSDPELLPCEAKTFLANVSAVHLKAIRDRIATLLEAAGIER